MKSSAGVPESLQKTGGQISHIQPPASILLQAPASLHHGVNFHESEERIVTKIILVSSSRDSSLSRFLRIGSVPQNMTQHLNSRFDFAVRKSLGCTRRGQIRLLPEYSKGSAFAVCTHKTPQGCMKRFINSSYQNHHCICSPFALCPLQSPFAPSCPCPAAWHGADPFIVQNLIGLASHIRDGIF